MYMGRHGLTPPSASTQGENVPFHRRPAPRCGMGPARPPVKKRRQLSMGVWGQLSMGQRKRNMTMNREVFPCPKYSHFSLDTRLFPKIAGCVYTGLATRPRTKRNHRINLFLRGLGDIGWVSWRVCDGTCNLVQALCGYSHLSPWYLRSPRCFGSPQACGGSLAASFALASAASFPTMPTRVLNHAPPFCPSQQ